MFVREHSRKTYVDRVMRDLYAYYSNSSDKCMTLFDRITSLMLEFHGIFQQFNEMAVLIDMEVPSEPKGELMAPLQSYRLRTRGLQPDRLRQISQSDGHS
ncbi:hypothetical protein AAVH_09992 [Aphelenchoides avenae]|nr:hypothetical protein AAVH_09992 [Aphelenchus avenae]